MVAFAANDQDRLLGQILEGLEASDLTDRQKRVFARKLKNRPRVRQTVLDEVIAQGFGEGLIYFEEGDVQAQVDWEGLIAFIERLIPIIIQLIGLFG